MPRYRKIDPRIWNDQKFSSFSERGKLLFFYVLTHPNMTMIGMLRATPEGLFSELGLSVAACQADWQALCQAGVVEYDKQGLIRLPNFLKYNEPESPSVVKAWADCYDLLPECELLEKGRRGIENYLISRGESWIKAYKHISKQPNGQPASQPAMQPARHQEQEQEQEQKQKIEERREEVASPSAPAPLSAVSSSKSSKPKAALTHKFDLEALPDAWREVCKQTRPDLDPDKVFSDFRFYWTQGSGSGQLRADKSWASTWATWVRREKEQRQAVQASTKDEGPVPAFGKMSSKQASFFGSKLAEVVRDGVPLKFRTGAQSWMEVGQRIAEAFLKSEEDYRVLSELLVRKKIVTV